MCEKCHFSCIIFLLCIICKQFCQIISKLWTYYWISLYLGRIKCCNFQNRVSFYSNKCLKCHFHQCVWGEILHGGNVHRECKTCFFIKTARVHKAMVNLWTQQENTNRSQSSGRVEDSRLIYYKGSHFNTCAFGLDKHNGDIAMLNRTQESRIQTGS